MLCLLLVQLNFISYSQGQSCFEISIAPQQRQNLFIWIDGATSSLSTTPPSSTAVAFSHVASATSVDNCISGCSVSLLTFRIFLGTQPSYYYTQEALAFMAPGNFVPVTLNETLRCVPQYGFCGATIPLYRHSRETSFGTQYAYTFTSAASFRNFTMEAIPVCYFWDRADLSTTVETSTIGSSATTQEPVTLNETTTEGTIQISSAATTSHPETFTSPDTQTTAVSETTTNLIETTISQVTETPTKSFGTSIVPGEITSNPIPVLTEEERVTEVFPLIAKQWYMDTEHDALLKTFEFTDFSSAWAFLTRIAMYAAKVDHFPNMLSSQNVVNITLRTFDAGGLTRDDILLANYIENLLL